MFVMEFKTARNTYGYRKYLAFDANKKEFTRNNPRMITEGIEIKTRDYNELVGKLVDAGFKEVDVL